MMLQVKTNSITEFEVTLSLNMAVDSIDIRWNANMRISWGFNDVLRQIAIQSHMSFYIMQYGYKENYYKREKYCHHY